MLTDAAVEAARPREKAYKLADAGGMYLLVTPAGAKYWRLKYRVHRRENSLSLGTFPDVPLATARRRRDDARALLARGGDPAEARRAERARARAERRRRPGFRFEMSPEGRLTINVPAGALTLTPDETQALQAFLAVTPKEERRC